jgi:hypothetical protein
MAGGLIRDWQRQKLEEYRAEHLDQLRAWLERGGGLLH